jgi:hypothetical protein
VQKKGVSICKLFKLLVVVEEEEEESIRIPIKKIILSKESK